MKASRRIAWLLGWAISPQRFAPLVLAAFPGDRHHFVPAAPGWAQALAAAGACDWRIGYSLGSLLLAHDRETSPVPAAAPGRVALLAPIWAFSVEAGAGGRVSAADLRALARSVGRDATKAVDGFSRFAGVADLTASDQPADLLWGLEQLSALAASPVLPAGWIGVAGADDPLLDAPALLRLVPTLHVIAGAAHHPASLLPALRRQIEAAEAA